MKILTWGAARSHMLFFFFISEGSAETKPSRQYYDMWKVCVSVSVSVTVFVCVCVCVHAYIYYIY
jgi:hypothetical protein